MFTKGAPDERAAPPTALPRGLSRSLTKSLDPAAGLQEMQKTKGHVQVHREPTADKVQTEKLCQARVFNIYIARNKIETLEIVRLK